jgi:hypothetical protein
MNYDKSSADFQSLVSAGIDPELAGFFSVDDLEGYLKREYMENRREQGYEVPEEYAEKRAGQKENEFRYREMLAFRCNGERDLKCEGGTNWREMYYDDDELVWDHLAGEWVTHWEFDESLKEAALRRLQIERNEKLEPILRECYMNKLRNAILSLNKKERDLRKKLEGKE